MKKAGKETCVCIYHLKWDKMISDYARERTALRKRMALLDPPLTCDCIIISNGHEARRKLTCRKEDDEPFLRSDCLSFKCTIRVPRV